MEKFEGRPYSIDRDGNDEMMMKHGARHKADAQRTNHCKRGAARGRLETGVEICDGANFRKLNEGTGHIQR